MISTLEEAARAANLTGINFLEVSGRRKEERSPAEDEVNISIRTQEQHTSSSCACRFAVAVDHPEADYLVEVEIRYDFDDDIDWSEDLIRGLVEEIAIMAAFPYLREGVAGIAARLGADVPFLGILRRGEFSMGEREQPEP